MGKIENLLYEFKDLNLNKNNFPEQMRSLMKNKSLLLSENCYLYFIRYNHKFKIEKDTAIEVKLEYSSVFEEIRVIGLEMDRDIYETCRNIDIFNLDCVLLSKDIQIEIKKKDKIKNSFIERIMTKEKYRTEEKPYIYRFSNIQYPELLYRFSCIHNIVNKINKEDKDIVSIYFDTMDNILSLMINETRIVVNTKEINTNDFVIALDKYIDIFNKILTNIKKATDESMKIVKEKNKNEYNKIKEKRNLAINSTLERLDLE